MRCIKFSVLLIFLISFLGGKAYCPTLQNNDKKNTTESSASKITKKITREDQDEDSPLKLKRRLRGVEVDVPHITDISFEQSFTYQALKTLWTDNIYTSFLYHVDLKRGPPLS